MAIKDLKQPNNEKEHVFCIQYLSKYIDNLSAQTDSLRQLLKKDTEWIWTEEHTQAFKNLQQKITKKPCLAHYNSKYPNVNNRCQHERGATLWLARGDTVARTVTWEIKTNRFRKPTSIGHRKKIRYIYTVNRSSY